MNADQELERLLLKIVAASPFAGKSYAVGGYVRDQLLGIASQDLDLVVEKKGGARALAEWLHARYSQAVSNPHELGAGYPIWQLTFKEDVVDGEPYAVKGATIEIADTQSEAFPNPTTRQRVTVFGTLTEDCARRDFTVNMLYRDLTSGEVVDPSGAGRADLSAGILRGHPRVDLNKIFSDDPLRMVRLVRFQSRFAWVIPPEVLETVTQNAARVRILSPERVRDELIKIMETGRLETALELFRTTGLLPELFPEFVPMVGCGQDRIYHSEGDVWVHTLKVISNTPRTVPLLLAALLHDVGKPGTRAEHGERVKFIGHETLSTEISEKFLTRLKFGAHLTRKVCRLVQFHLRGGDATQWTSLKPARKLIREAADELDELVQLIEADSRSSLAADGRPRLDHLPVLRDALDRARVIPVQRKPVLNGEEIMAELGLRPGKQVRDVIEFLMELEDEFADRGQALSKEDARARLKNRAKF